MDADLVRLVSIHLRRRNWRRARDLECAVDFTVLHEIAPADCIIGGVAGARLLDILGEVQPDVAEGDALCACAGRVLLHDVEVHLSGVQGVAALVDRQAHGQRLRVVVLHAVLADVAFCRAAAVLSRGGVR